MSAPSIASLKDKVAIVTGSSSGIGREIAVAYAEAGALVVCADLRHELPPKASATVTYPGVPTHEALNSHYASQNSSKPRAVFIQVDVTSASSVESLVAATVAQYGRLDIIVNNAGILAEAHGKQVFPRIHETPEATWDADLAVNAKGVWLCTKYAVTQMLKQEPHQPSQDRGWVINMSSIVGIAGFAGTSSYTASKGAVLQLTKAVALEYAKDRIHVNSIHPGFTDTALLEPLKAAHGSETAKKMLADLHPWGTVGKATDIAKVAVFLGGDGASWCTGAPFIVDGGYLAQ
jgi:NAD(P)-dependent dehydrogenase (short-subunit alcohol dehydrogenase family)